MLSAMMLGPVVVNGFRAAWDRVCALADVIARQRRPYIKATLLLMFCELIFVAHGVIRARALYDEISPTYVALLYGGGLVSLVVDSAWRALIFFLLFRNRMQSGFGTVYLGVVVFANIVDGAAALTNLIAPVVFVFNFDPDAFSYSVVSVPYLLGMPGESPVARIVLSMLDGIVLLRLWASAFYVARVADKRFWIVFLAAAAMELLARGLSVVLL